MRIQHNIAALNAYRNLTNNNSAVSKNLEKLSSGYKINRAGDDAAGLAISEKMRAQITGLETAQKNANDGISLVQTAEGALTEVHSMLNRMLELANQSANGTYQNAVDRENLQKELTALQDEIDRVADATNFNGIYVLNGMVGAETEGTVGDTAAQISGALADDTVTETTTGAAGTAAAVYDFDLSGLTFESDGEVTLTVGNYSVDVAVTKGMSAADFADAAVAAINGAQWGDGKDTGVLTAAAAGSGKITLTAKNQAVDASSGLAGGGTVSVTPAQTGATDTSAKTYEATITGGDANALANGDEIVIGGKTYTLTTGNDSGDNIDPDTHTTFEDQINAAIAKYNREAGEDFTAAYADGKITFTAKDGTTPTAAPTFTITDGASNISAGAVTEVVAEEEGAAGPAEGSLILQVGDSDEEYNQITVTVANMHAKNLGVSKDDINISTQTDALAAIQKIKDAINSVSSTRGDLGAIQNRLEHTINNLSVTTENMTAAESRIRDVDMAEEMMAYTKNNILVQASQAMLAQANQIPQGVLQLLQ